jgi:RNA polymerase sigma-70 factor, ECF subfamily
MAGDALLEQVQRGDRQALEDLCSREWRPVYALIYRAVPHPSEAQDLTQEVFLRAYQSLPRYQVGDAPFHAYLATIARNLLRDRWRWQRPASVELTEELGLPGPDIEPEDWAMADAEGTRILDALAMLPADYQTVLRLRVLDGRPADEVAALMARSPAALRQLQHRALVALRGLLQTGARR